MEEKILGASLPPVMALAYLGDARHALYVRYLLVRRGLTKSGELNKCSLAYVTAEAQAAAYRKIEPMLNDDERAVFKRAANSGHLNRPKHASVADYRHATGFEAVIGMHSYLGNEARIIEILTEAHKESCNDTEN